MKREEESIKLYRCFHCNRQQFIDKIERGISCKCGSIKYRLANPTPWAIFRYLLHNYGVFGMLRQVFSVEILDAAPEPRVRPK